MGGVASALELKDHLWGGKADWLDWSLTIAGGVAGFGTRILLATLIH